MNKPRVKGTRGENRAVEFWRTWFPGCERRALRGVRDAGDLAGLPMVVSVKNCETWPIHKWLSELQKMRANTEQHGVIQARRSRGQWVFILPEDVMASLMDAVHGRWTNERSVALMNVIDEAEATS